MLIISIQRFRNILYEYQNFIIVIGLVISFSGGSWDITFHILSQPESFFSYPHTLVYTGILIVISIFFINFRKNLSSENPTRKDNCFILLGAGLIIAAGPFDFSWHLKFGLDGLLSPPHITLLTGWLLVGLGNLRITNKLIDLTIERGKENEKEREGDGALKGNSVGTGGPAHRHPQVDARNDYEKYDTINQAATNLYNKATALLKYQLFLNLSFILMILSGFIYFFSLPFSETQYYNYNPDPLIAFFVYSLGFPLLLSCFFINILKKYPGFEEMVLLVGSFYVVIMLLTQILSNPFLVYYSWYYILNIIPFVVIYLLNKMQIKNKRFTKRNTLVESDNSEAAGEIKDHTNTKLYIFYALILSISSITICFPLNTYILNEELYGYLVYQNLVFKVFIQIFFDYFMIIIPISVIGGLLGFWLESVTASKYKIFHFGFRQYFSGHR